MTILRRWCSLTLAGSALVVGAVALAPTASAASCSDVDIAFARGTGEPAGPGSVGRPFVQDLAGDLAGRSVSSYAVDYPASYNQKAGPGATDLSRHVSSVAAQCPSTRFVIGGYSQGATVVDQALGIRTGTSTGQSIPTSLASRIAAVVVYGNPLNASGRTVANSAPTYADRTKEYCNSGDAVCGYRGSTSGSHLSYQTNGTVPDGAQYAAGKVTTSAS